MPVDHDLYAAPSSGRSTRTPLTELARAPTSATRWGASTAHHRTRADSISVNSIANPTPGHHRAVAHHGEGRLDRLGPVQVNPVLGLVGEVHSACSTAPGLGSTGGIT